MYIHLWRNARAIFECDVAIGFSRVKINRDALRERAYLARRRGVVNHRTRVAISPRLAARINRMQRGEGFLHTATNNLHRTCVRGRVNDVITLIRARTLGPGMQSEFVAGAENRARYRRAA